METSVGKAKGELAVKALADLTRTQITEAEKTRRYLITVVMVLFSLALIVPLFVPEGKDTTLVTVGLIILGLGAIGVQRFVLKIPGVDIRSQIEELKNQVDRD